MVLVVLVCLCFSVFIFLGTLNARCIFVFSGLVCAVVIVSVCLVCVWFVYVMVFVVVCGASVFVRDCVWC